MSKTHDINIAYQAKNPGIIAKRWKNSWKYCACPAALLTDALSITSHFIFQKALLKGMLPAATFTWSELPRKDGHLSYIQQRKLFNQLKAKDYTQLNKTYQTQQAKKILENIAIKEFILQTYDGALLSSAEIIPQDATKYKYIICFPGNYYIFEMTQSNKSGDLTFIDFAKLAITCKQRLILFNYRGVGLSKKNFKHIMELIIDGIAEVQYLLDKGIKPQDITLYGHSKGGSVAIYVAAYMHGNGYPVKLIADRTYCTAAHVSSTRGFLGKFNVGINQLILEFLDLQLCPDNYYLHIPEKYRLSFSLPAGLDKTILSHVDFSSSVKDDTVYYLYPNSDIHRDNHHSTPFSDLHVKMDHTTASFESVIAQYTNQNLQKSKTKLNNENQFEALITLHKPEFKIWSQYLIINIITSMIIVTLIAGLSLKTFTISLIIGVLYTITIFSLMKFTAKKGNIIKM